MTLTDCKSKFGSVVNRKKLSANEKVELFPSSELKFGQGNAGTFRYTCIYNQEYVIKERREVLNAHKPYIEAMPLETHALGMLIIPVYLLSGICIL